MTFSSIQFMLIFFPIAFILYSVAPSEIKNAVFAVESFSFYYWAEGKRALLLLLFILVHFFFGYMVATAKKQKKLLYRACIGADVFVLILFKVANTSLIIKGTVLERLLVPMPIGLSFIVFFGISYLADVYNNVANYDKNIWSLSVYIGSFVHVLSGPIDLYRDFVSHQNIIRKSVDDYYYGARRFIYGLTKKVVLADYFSLVTDRIFSIPIGEMSTYLVWVGMIVYFFQIYYDFSGYSDMAIGVGRVFGFRIAENFSYPYCAGSISDFWRRWHSTLSRWFREYVYFPLGGSRCSNALTLRNIAIVFILTGIWHGNGSTFLVFGLWNAFCVIADRYLLKRMNGILKRILTLLVILIGWVLFRSSSLQEAMYIFQKMFIFSEGNGAHLVSQYIQWKAIILLIVATVFCGIVQTLFPKFKEYLYDEKSYHWCEALLLFVLLILGLAKVTTGTYRAFIYFQF